MTVSVYVELFTKANTLRRKRVNVPPSQPKQRIQIPTRHGNELRLSPHTVIKNIIPRQKIRRGRSMNNTENTR